MGGGEGNRNRQTLTTNLYPLAVCTVNTTGIGKMTDGGRVSSERPQKSNLLAIYYSHVLLLNSSSLTPSLNFIKHGSVALLANDYLIFFSYEDIT